MAARTKAPAGARSSTARARAVGLGFIEVIAEAIGAHDDLPAGVAAAIERGLQVVPHGVSLSLGGAERPDRERLAHLASVAERVNAPLVSEHIAFVRADGRESRTPVAGPAHP